MGPFATWASSAQWRAPVLWALAVLILLVDAREPPGLALEMLYTPLLVLFLFLSETNFRMLTVTTMVLSLLILSGGLLTPEHGAHPYFWIQRWIAMGLLWTIALLGSRNLVRLSQGIEDKYRRLFDGASLGMFHASTSDGGRFLTANQALATMLGYERPEDLLALRLDAQVWSDQKKPSQALHGQFTDAAQPGGVTVEWRRRDGEPISVRLAGVPVRDADGSIIGFDTVAEDVTVQQRLERQLRAAQKMEAIGQLTSGIAHDFNNILAVILSAAELLLLKLPPNSDLRGEVEELKLSAERGSEMVRRLLSFGRREMLTFAELDPGQVQMETATLLRRLLPATIQLEVRQGTELGSLWADRAAVEQMLLNLSTNARDAMPDGGVLTLETERTTLDAGYHADHPWIKPGEYIRFSVSDTGTGMDERTKEHLFEPFFTNKAPGEGTGLGMAMVYGLIKQHGGMVHVYSELGQGTTVRIYFPAQQHTPGAEPKVTVTTTSLPRGSETILCVDDNPAIRRMTERALSLHGYRVLLAGDGEEALAIYRDHSNEISMVLADLVMPGLGGRQLADALHQQGHRVPVLFSSGYSGDSIAALSELGAVQPILRKPWSISELLTRVRETIDSADKLKPVL